MQQALCDDRSTAGFKSLFSPVSGILDSPSFLTCSLSCSFMLVTLVEESVSSLFVCSNGQVKWLVLESLPLMAGRRLLWWRSLCPKTLAHTPAWQKTAQGKHPAALLCLSGVSIQISSKSKHNFLLIINPSKKACFLRDAGFLIHWNIYSVILSDHNKQELAKVSFLMFCGLFAFSSFWKPIQTLKLSMGRRILSQMWPLLHSRALRRMDSLPKTSYQSSEGLFLRPLQTLISLAQSQLQEVIR